jgi:ABC-type hemin transport system substrate-binding protein
LNDTYFETSPQRIISLVPSQTELLYDLGQEAKIVGITKFVCIPTILDQLKKRVGGTKSTLKKIRLLNPILSFAIRKKTPRNC